jgi:hypothetical protein
VVVIPIVLIFIVLILIAFDSSEHLL